MPISVADKKLCLRGKKNSDKHHGNILTTGSFTPTEREDDVTFLVMCDTETDTETNEMAEVANGISDRVLVQYEHLLYTILAILIGLGISLGLVLGQCECTINRIIPL